MENKRNHVLHVFSLKFASYTPNANMADHLVGTQDESNGSEASEALMFCFENASPENSCLLCRRSVPFYFAVPTSCCVSECDEKG